MSSKLMIPILFALIISGCSNANFSETQPQLENTTQPKNNSTTQTTATPKTNSFSHTQNKYTVIIPEGWEVNRDYPGGKYTNTEIQSQDSVIWNKSNAILLIEKLSGCTQTLEKCISNYQKEQGPLYTKNIQRIGSSTISGGEAIIEENKYNLSSIEEEFEAKIKTTFFKKDNYLWLIEIRRHPQDTQSLQDYDTVVKSFKDIEI